MNMQQVKVLGLLLKIVLLLQETCVYDYSLLSFPVGFAWFISSSQPR
jgi:hypothetical protein